MAQDQITFLSNLAGGCIFFVLALVHAAAALKHHFVDRDEVLKRMLPWTE